MTGRFDCSNPRCARYHEIVTKQFSHERRPRCSSCRHALRLIRVVARMDEATKAVLRDRAKAQRRADATGVA